MKNASSHFLHQREIDRVRHALRNHPSGSKRSANELAMDNTTDGDHLADKITNLVGSWKFIIAQSSLLALWLILNSIGWLLNWDPYPFILLNLVLSFQAAFTAPIIMMSQNRQASRDRIASELDFEVNRVAAKEVEAIQNRLDTLSNQQWENLLANLAEHRVLLEALHERTNTIEALIENTQNPGNPV